MKLKAIIIFLSALIIGFASYYFLASTHPSDKSMKTFFEHNRADFEKLRVMFEEDKNCRLISYEGTFPVIDYSKENPESECQISEARHNEYRKLFERLGVHYSISRDCADCNDLTFTKSFITVDDSDFSEHIYTKKGYIHNPKKPSSLKESLDNSNSYGYKKLDGDWYIFHETGVSKPE